MQESISSCIFLFMRLYMYFLFSPINLNTSAENYFFIANNVYAAMEIVISVYAFVNIQ